MSDQARAKTGDGPQRLQSASSSASASVIGGRSSHDRRTFFVTHFREQFLAYMEQVRSALQRT